MAARRVAHKWESFAREFLVDCNGTRAAIRAGYSARSAHVQASALLKNPKVLALIAAERAKLVERTEATQDWVIRTLLTNAARAAQAEPVTNEQGDPTGEYVYQGAVVNRAAELIGKHLGMFVERHQLEGGEKIGLAAARAILQRRATTEARRA